MNQRDMDILENAFFAEIKAALEKSKIPGMVQGKSKRLLKLVEDGYLQPVHWESRGQLGTFRVDGYCLTILGNATYCMSDRCDDIPAKPEQLNLSA